MKLFLFVFGFGALILFNSCSNTENISALNDQFQDKLIVGLVNPIKLSEKYNNEKYVLTNDTVGVCKYDIVCQCYPISVPSSGLYKFYIKSIKKNRIETLTLRAYPLPNPSLDIPGTNLEQRKVKLDSLLEISQLNIKPLFGIEEFEVVSFQFAAIVDTGYISMKSQNNQLTIEMKDKIEQLKRGQKVWFENIELKFPDGSVRMISALSLVVD